MRFGLALSYPLYRSSRKHATVLVLPTRTVKRFQIPSLQCNGGDLFPPDCQNRLPCCQTVGGHSSKCCCVLHHDEVYFHLTGCVNKQIMRYWSATNPCELHERFLHSYKVTVWYAISAYSVIGFYLLENDNGSSVTITSGRYVDMFR